MIRNQKGFAVIWFVLVGVIIGVVVVGGVVWQRSNEQKRKEQAETQQRQEKEKIAQQDEERKAEIKTIFNAAEVFYASNGFYPTAANMADTDFITKTLKADLGAFTDSKGVRLGEAESEYQFRSKPIGCTGEACIGYTLSAKLSDGTVFEKQSLN